jgi:hypothetical protein
MAQLPAASSWAAVQEGWANRALPPSPSLGRLLLLRPDWPSGQGQVLSKPYGHCGHFKVILRPRGGLSWASVCRHEREGLSWVPGLGKEPHEELVPESLEIISLT